ncbi:hypothetical protein GOP47_0004136 [Adiantum capillus-veneris]|uniref:Glycosyltransferase n=2 Tax=Adiantum capillus-veneris TaxID=13818 RepID=A0A9D4V7C0_ADICA|nr:hypothetical protein GOP47_0004136 [Adiantum capillus-veneris]
MGVEEEGNGVLHMLVVSFQAEGHLNAILRLAQNLAAREGVIVTFAYPARFHHLALQRNGQLAALLASPVVQQSKLRIRVVEDGLPREEAQGLTPPIVLASIPIYQHNVKLLLDQLLAERPYPVCLISDTFVPWTQDLANAAHLPRVDFWTSTAAVYSMGSQLSLLVSKGILPLHHSCWVDPETKWSANTPLIEGVPGLPPFPATDLPKEFLSGEEFALQFMLAAFGRVREAHTILVHSLYELEASVFDALRAMDLPIHPVGPLSDDSPTPAQLPGVDGSQRHECLHWLDTQPVASVIYVALGSIAKLSPSEMHALALALEACKRPFLWVIRIDSVSSPLDDALPPGFLNRTVDQGSGLIISWAPQTQVLSHPSVCAFFSHCGWNSTLECMWEGIPMVACPRAAEQRSNAKWIVGTWKIGVPLERELDGSFTQEAIEKALQELLSKDKFDYYKRKALCAKEMARHALQEKGSSNANILNLLQKLRHNS